MSKIGTDVVQGFVLNSDCGYWSLIHQANGAHLTAKQRYTELLRKLQTDGVAFKDIKSRLLNLAKDAGLYVPATGPWCDVDSKGAFVPALRPYNDLVKAKVAWAVALGNFLGYVSRNWNSYTEEKEDTTANKKFKGKITLNVGGEQVECTITGLTATQFEDYGDKIGILAPVEDLSTDDLVALYNGNQDFLLSELGNRAIERDAVAEYDLLMEKISPDHILGEVDMAGNQ